MYQISNFTDNDDVNVLVEFGAFKVIEWKRDLSVTESSAITAYFASEMNVRRRQVICDLSQAPSPCRPAPCSGRSATSAPTPA